VEDASVYHDRGGGWWSAEDEEEGRVVAEDRAEVVEAADVEHADVLGREAKNAPTTKFSTLIGML